MTSTISIICAVSKNNVIGVDGKLPWNIPADLKYFRKLTMGKTVIMGRKTYESIGKPLKGRHNIIMSKSNFTTNECCIIATSVDDALSKSIGDIMIIGGYEIYKQFLHLAQNIYMTLVDCEIIKGNITYFIQLDNSWTRSIIAEYEANTNIPAFSFLHLTR